MKVYKFGGASVRSADGVRNLARIVAACNDRLFVIVSAMGKTTNALERILDAFYEGRRGEALQKMQDTVDYHNAIIADLWGAPALPARIAGLYAELEETLATGNPSSRGYEVWYDRIVSYGELLSTTIVSEYLASEGMPNRWVDMRECFVTNARHKDANVDMERSAARLLETVNGSAERLFVGQGFIGATEDGAPTTIGREGSDYSAAVAGYILDATDVTIWKDVPGILNGDPKRFSDVELIPRMSYLDAIELAYSGAQIIHPKTIKPLRSKGIPLHVRSFVDPSLPGSVICEGVEKNHDLPIFILKPAQVLLTIQAADLSFILEERFASIFALLEQYMIKVNMIQSSAVNLDLCTDRSRHLDELTEKLRAEGYHTTYNTDMELLTVRNYTPQQVRDLAQQPDVYLTQRTRRTMQIVRRAKND